jgi:hypothetical protein
MTWQEMSDEILADVAQIMSASSTTEYVVGVMQWRSKTVAGPVYQPNILPVKVHDGETPADVSGVSILPDPDTVRCGHWRPVNLKLTPKINGIATSEDVPALYLVGLKPPGAQGVAFPSRYGGGVVLLVRQS